MTGAYIRKDKTAPLWAVLGAPLIGVPLMVGLLALAAPGEAEPATEPNVEFAVEQAEEEVVGSPLEVSPDEPEPAIRRS